MKNASDLKVQLEQDITKLIKAFVKETGAKVTEIDVYNDQMNRLDGSIIGRMLTVRIKAEI